MSTFNNIGPSGFDPFQGFSLTNPISYSNTPPSQSQINESLHHFTEVNVATEASVWQALQLIQTWNNSTRVNSSTQLNCTNEGQHKLFSDISNQLGITLDYNPDNFNKLFLEIVPSKLAGLGVISVGRSVRFPTNDSSKFLFVPFDGQFYIVKEIKNTSIRLLNDETTNIEVLRSEPLKTNCSPVNNLPPSCILHSKVFIQELDFKSLNANNKACYKLYCEKGFTPYIKMDLKGILLDPTFEQFRKSIGDKQAAIHILCIKLLEKVNGYTDEDYKKSSPCHEGQHINDKKNPNLTEVWKQRSANNDDAEIFLEIRGRLNEFNADKDLALLEILASVQKVPQVSPSDNPSLRNRIYADLIIFNTIIESLINNKDNCGIQIFNTIDPSAEVCLQLDKVEFTNKLLEDLTKVMMVSSNKAISDPRVIPTRLTKRFV